MVTVLGGEVGMDFTVSLNSPTITGATLLGQRAAAISYDGLEALSVVGTTIKPAPGAVALRVTSPPSSKWGEASVIDTTIEFEPALDAASAAFASNRSLYLRNVASVGVGSRCVVGAYRTGLARLIPRLVLVEWRWRRSICLVEDHHLALWQVAVGSA